MQGSNTKIKLAGYLCEVKKLERNNLSTSYQNFFNDTATTEIYTLSLHNALVNERFTRTARIYQTTKRNHVADLLNYTANTNHHVHSL